MAVSVTTFPMGCIFNNSAPLLAITHTWAERCIVNFHLWLTGLEKTAHISRAVISYCFIFIEI